MALLETLIDVVSEKDFIVPFPTVDLLATESDCSFAELDFFANFLSNGFACCCSSVKTGFCERTFF